MQNAKTKIDSEIESLYKSGFFVESRELALPKLQIALELKSFDQALEYAQMLIRMNVEMEDRPGLAQIYEIIENNSEFLQICERHPKYLYARANAEADSGQKSKAAQLLDQAVELALQQDDLEALTYALIGQTKLLIDAKPIDGELVQSNLHKIKLLLEKIKNSDLWVVFYLLEANYLLDIGQLNMCVEKSWEAFERSKQSKAPAYYAVSVFAVLGYAYLTKKDFAKASIYLNIAKKSLNLTSMNRLSRIVDTLIQHCPQETEDYDFLLDLADKKIKLKSKQEIDLKNQFVLIDLVKLFFEQKDSPITKMDLVEKVWHETYDPSRHDNLIYVTIKRLRNLLKADKNDADDIIIRSKYGYSLKSGLVAVIR